MTNPCVNSSIVLPVWCLSCALGFDESRAQVWASVTTLESDWALEIAKATVIELMQDAVTGSKPPSSTGDGPADDVVTDSSVSDAVDEEQRNTRPDEPAGEKAEKGAGEIVVDVADKQSRDQADGDRGGR